MIIIRASNHKEGSEKQMTQFLPLSLRLIQIKTLLQKEKLLPLRQLVMYFSFYKKYNGDTIFCDLDIT